MNKENPLAIGLNNIGARIKLDFLYARIMNPYYGGIVYRDPINNGTNEREILNISGHGDKIYSEIKGVGSPADVNIFVKSNGGETVGTVVFKNR